jgi:hypothetical protein
MLAEALSVSRDEAGVMSAVTVNHRSVVVGVPDQLFEKILVRVEVFPSVEAFAEFRLGKRHASCLHFLEQTQRNNGRVIHDWLAVGHALLNAVYQFFRVRCVFANCSPVSERV